MSSQPSLFELPRFELSALGLLSALIHTHSHPLTFPPSHLLTFSPSFLPSLPASQPLSPLLRFHFPTLPRLSLSKAAFRPPNSINSINSINLHSNSAHTFAQRLSVPTGRSGFLHSGENRPVHKVGGHLPSL